MILLPSWKSLLHTNFMTLFRDNYIKIQFASLKEQITNSDISDGIVVIFYN